MVGKVAALGVGLQRGKHQVAQRLAERHVVAAARCIQHAAQQVHLCLDDRAVTSTRAGHILAFSRAARGFLVAVAQHGAGLQHAQHLNAEQAQPGDRVGGPGRQPVTARAGTDLERLQRERGVPVHRDGLVSAGDGVEHDQLVLGWRRRCLHNGLPLAGLGADFLVNVSAKLAEVAGAPGGAAQHAGDGSHMGMHAPLEMQPANARAPGFNQQADGVLEPVGIAAGIGLGASHRNFPVSHVRGGRVVPLGAQALALERIEYRAAVPLLGGLGQKFRQVGGSAVLQQCIRLLDRAEFLQKAANHVVLVGIHHNGRLVVAREPCQCLSFRRVEQQMVAVHVQPARSDALVAGRAIRIGTRNNQHIDVLQ